MTTINKLTKLLEEKKAQRDSILKLSDLEFLYKINSLTTLSFEISSIRNSLNNLK